MHTQQSDPEYQWLGEMPYEALWHALQQSAEALADGAEQESIRCCVHQPVYTTGRRGIDTRVGERLPAPVVQSDRGGEMTFHGPGQLMLYPVIHLRQRDIGAKAYVHLLEQSCIELLAEYGIRAERRCGFPGVWTPNGKIAALGVRISRGIAFHGMALNVAVDPEWFAAIRPCGLSAGVVSMRDFAVLPDLEGLAGQWQRHFSGLLAAQAHTHD